MPEPATPAPVTRDDLERKLREIEGEVLDTGAVVKQFAIAAAAASLIVVVALAYGLGRRLRQAAPDDHRGATGVIGWLTIEAQRRALRGGRTWATIWVVLLTLRLARRLLREKPETLFLEQLGPGDSVFVTNETVVSVEPERRGGRRGRDRAA